jgi:hypothetical protein
MMHIVRLQFAAMVQQLQCKLTATGGNLKTDRLLGRGVVDCH